MNHMNRTRTVSLSYYSDSSSRRVPPRGTPLFNTVRQRESIRPLSHILILTAVSLGVLLTQPPNATADAIHRFTLRGEGGIGTMLPSFQRGPYAMDIATHGSARPAFTLFNPLALQLTFSSWWFPSPAGNGQVYLLGGGLRLEPMLGSVGRLGFDADVGVAFTGPLTRLMFDAGITFEFALTRWFGLGPVVRYGHVFATSPDTSGDAQFWAAGLSAAIRVPEPSAAPAAPADTDRDGVIDSEDACPNEPMGEHPDPARRGCPQQDTDRDGVFDPADQCVNEPAGARADPVRTGCPLRDADNDGVFDNTDACPSVAQGSHPDPERAGCPDGDDDSDGVLNHADQCRTVAQGALPDATRPGCPAPDRDHDSVPDATDHCPDQPGAPSPDPNRNGCPGLLQIDNGVIRILTPVFFATLRDTILPRSFPVLTAVRDALRVTPSIQHLTVDGHTDDVGDDAANLDLSRRRAQSVVAYLVANGVEAARLEAHGSGETRPVVPVTAGMRRRAIRVARAQNRRVEFRISNPTPTPTPAPAAATRAPSLEY